ncbi:MAG TPA: class I SAM-dependent methyltransferase [Micropepsaceae bacterium]|jgi:2-polyprenyl-3-methyl-5-hydroxy-6-metoxy-1,4-benzoquinol methylase|nr:class I SAM-dependent methyltransferase [Micropepsaceae bacterium]
MRMLDGEPLVQRCVAQVRQFFPDTPIRIVAPHFDRGGLDAIARSVEDCQVSYSFDDKPLKRMIAATEDLGEDDLVLRVDGLHCFFQHGVIRDLLAVAEAEALDLAKSPDDFPPPLTGEVWRVGALRHMDRMLSQMPAESAAPHWVHPKFLAMRAESGLRTTFVPPPQISNALLSQIRAELMRAFDEDHNEVTRKSIGAGDQISFHYVLARRHLKPDDCVLDIASGKGFGGNIMAEVAASVMCADLDRAKLDEGRTLFPRANLTFSCEDVTATRFPDNSFDVVVSMETIEHMDDVDLYLGELKRVLKPGGRAILSTPQNSIGHIPLTPAHIHEFSLDELRSSCGRHFEIETIIGLKAGTVYFADDPIGANSVIFLRKS